MGVKKLEKRGLSVNVNIFTVDWVTVSFKKTDVYSVIAMIGLDQDKFTYSEKFRHGYPCIAEFGHIQIYYNPDGVNSVPQYPKANKGCCLNMSGQGCREFESYCPALSWSMLFSRFELLDGNFTRLDLSYDDRAGIIPLPRLAMDIADDNFIGHARYTQRLYSHDYDNDIDGLTVYVGSKKSDLYVRIYDKAAERGYRPSEMHWVRVEIQMRNSRALLAARAVATDPHIGNVFAGILANYLRILQPVADSNKSRWPVADYWQAILGDVSSLHLTMPGIEYNFRKSEVHFLNQYKQFLYAYSKIYGKDAPQRLFDEVFGLCEGDEIKQKYLMAIRDHAQLNGSVEDPSEVVERENAVRLHNFIREDELRMLRLEVDHLRAALKDLMYRDADTVSLWDDFSPSS